MNEQAHLMTLIWEGLAEFISPGDKQEAADALVKSFMEFHDIDELFDADGECPYIDRALAASGIEDDEAEEEYEG